MEKWAFSQGMHLTGLKNIKWIYPLNHVIMVLLENMLTYK